MSNPVIYPKTSTQLSAYSDPGTSPWAQMIQTPKQKMISYFSSCLEVLGIQEEVALTEEILKKAYKRAAITAHPDKGGSEDKFEAITRAYAALNQMFEKTHIVDPDHDGYGDWLKDETGDAKTKAFTGKFNRDVFNSMFDAEAKRKGGGSASNQLIHPEAMALTLAPSMGLEIGRERPDTFTPAPNSKQHFSDLKDAYSRETTISDKVANVRVETRSLDIYRASRERAPDPLNDREKTQLYEAEAHLKQREQQRQLRAASQGLVEQQYFDRMKQLVITDRK